MKKIILVPMILAAAFFTVSIVTGCTTPPPPAPVEEPPPPPEPEPEAQPVLPPSINVSLSPQPFGPDGDGTDDELTIAVSVTSQSPIVGWSVLVSEPVEPYLPFYELSGEGDIPGSITWDGIGTSGELVQSAMDYPLTVSVTDADGQTAVFEGVIRIDVLVRNEGGTLRVIVPSIMFGPNIGDFSGLAEDVMENNDRVLRRIAEILNRFGEYSIRIEGHANPTTPPNTRRRTQEEEGSRREIGLQPLSEERAKTVLEYLANLGVNSERLSSVGMGGTRVIVEYENNDYWWQNRRVEFILVR
jgi:hypothetical protein